jgi:hypothetical protein
MPLTQLNFQPGLDTENTPTGAEGKWVDGDKIRFRKGLPQKIGGWTKFSPSYYVGVGRALEQWFALNGSRFEALGTDRKVYAFTAGNSQDITPIRGSIDVLVNAITTTTSSNILTITDAGHGATAGDFVTLSGTTAAVGGIPAATLNAEYEILTISNTNAYTIQSSATANANVGPTANCTAAYQISTGPSVQTFGYGWGSGTWGNSTWGTPRTSSNVILDARLWSINNWGEDLILTQKDGSTYEWDTSLGMSNNRATVVANAPTNSTLSIISTETRHVVCMGTETAIGNTASQDKMFIRWSDQENYNFWTPNVTNSAGSQRIAGGSEIRCARPAKGSMLIWTDTTMQSMSFIGPPFIFGFRQLGNDCGAVGLNSAIVVDDVAYWMSDGQFFRYAGSVQEIPCPILNHVFENINKTQYPQVYAAQNSNFSEVIWYYCSSAANQNDRYVIYNYLENSWCFGNMSRSTYQDNGVELNPLATEYFPNSNVSSITTINGVTQGRSIIYAQESGVDADGAALPAYIQSGDGDIADGETFSFINKVIPDFQNQTGNTVITLNVKDYPNDTATVGETLTVNNTTRFVNTRIRGRQSNIKIENNNIGDNWRFGTLRVNIKQDGKR